LRAKPDSRKASSSGRGSVHRLLGQIMTTKQSNAKLSYSTARSNMTHNLSF
jgi:hypothetical protein